MYSLYLGIYDWRTGIRLPVLDENKRAISHRIFIGEIEVIDRSK